MAKRKNRSSKSQQQILQLNVSHSAHKTKTSNNSTNEQTKQRSGYNDAVRTFLSKDAQAIVRMRGLPFSCTAKQVVDFFAGSNDASDTGAIQITAATADDTKSSACEANKSKPKKKGDKNQSTLQTCRVLAGEDGVLFVKNHDDKPTGDAFVLFASDEEANRALRRHHQNIGSRYVELFRSTISEVQQVLSSCTAQMSADGSNQYNNSSSHNRVTKGLHNAQQQRYADDNGNSIAGLAQQCWPLATGLTPTSSVNSNNDNNRVRTHHQQQATYALVAQSNRSNSKQTIITISSSHSSSSDANYESETSGCGGSEYTDRTTNGSNTTVDSGSSNNNTSSDTSSDTGTAGSSMEIEDSAAKISGDSSARSSSLRDDLDGRSDGGSSSSIMNGKSSPDEQDSIEEVVVIKDQQPPKGTTHAKQQQSSNSPNCPSDIHCSGSNQTGAIAAAVAATNSSRQVSGKSHHGNNNNGQSYAWRQHNNHQHHWPAGSSSPYPMPMATLNHHHHLTHQHQQVAAGINPMSHHHHMLVSHHQAAAAHYATTTSMPPPHQNQLANHHGHWASQVIGPQTTSASGHHYYYTPAGTLPPDSYPRHHQVYATSPSAYPYPNHEPINSNVAVHPPLSQQQQQQQTHSSDDASAEAQLADADEQPNSSSTSASSAKCPDAKSSAGAPVSATAEPPEVHEQEMIQSPMCQIDPNSCYYSPQQLYAQPHHYQLPSHMATSCYQPHHHQHHTVTYTNEPLPQPQLANSGNSHINSRYNGHYYNSKSNHNHNHHHHQNSYNHLQTAAPVTTTTAAANSITSRRDCIRLRGLPFEAKVDDILRFLGSHSANILYQGVHMVYSPTGQPTGEAVVQMVSCADATNASQVTHKRVMTVGKKKRYIEVIPSSIDDMRPTLGPGLAALLNNVSTAAHQPAAGTVSPDQQQPMDALAHQPPAALMANGVGPYHAPATTATTYYPAPPPPIALANDDAPAPADSKQDTDQPTDGFMTDPQPKAFASDNTCNQQQQANENVAVVQELVAQ